MAIRYYIVPKVLTTLENGMQMLVPKYVGTTAGLDWGATDFGGNDIMLVKTDLSDSDHALIVAQPDAYAWPPLDARLTNGQYNRFTTFCENNGIPSDKFSQTMNAGRILLTLIKIWQFHQRLNGVGLSRLFAGARTQETLVGALPTNVKQRLQDAIVSFNWDNKYLSDNLSLRDVVKQCSDFFTGRVKFAEIDERT